MAKTGKIGLLLGVVTGAVTGLLFAPQRGKDLRKNIVKERQSGGLGHKAIADNMTSMADEIADLVKEVVKSEEAKHFWAKTNETVSDLTGGSVELDEWVKNAHEKADNLKKTVSEYAREKKKSMKQATDKAKSRVTRGVKKAKSTAKKAVKRAKSTVKKATRKGTARVKKRATRKPSTSKKK